MKRKRLTLMLALLATLLVASFAIADAPVAVEVAVAVDEVGVGELAEQTEKMLNDWEALGWIYGIIGIISLLMLGLRFKPINDLLAKKDWKKYKPYISAVLGGLLAFFVAWGELGNVWPQAVMAGLIGIAGGLAVVGGHQVVTGANKR